VRVNWNRGLAAAILAGASFACVTNAARAQDGQFLMPEQSAAKAKELIRQAIDALGGAAYLNVRDITCTGRTATFEHSGELSDFLQLNDSRQLPDKERLEYVRKGHNTIAGYVLGVDGLEFTHGGIVVTVYNGSHGWSYDRSGVNELPADYVDQFHEQLRTNLGTLLRARVNEPDMVLRYGGEDAVDLKAADWVELTDGQDRTIRIAIAQSSHLPIREVVQTKDPKLHTKAEEIDYFSNYHVFGGIQTPLQTAQERNGIKTSQTFFDKCEYNTSPPAAAFTKESLDQRWAQVPEKQRAQEKKEAAHLKEKQQEDQDSDDTTSKK